MADPISFVEKRPSLKKRRLQIKPESGLWNFTLKGSCPIYLNGYITNCTTSFEPKSIQIELNLIRINPHLPKVCFETRPPKGMVTIPSLEFGCKVCDSYDFVDRYGPLLSIHTKNVPVSLHMTSQWRQGHINFDFIDLWWKYVDSSNFSQN